MKTKTVKRGNRQGSTPARWLTNNFVLRCFWSRRGGSRMSNVISFAVRPLPGGEGRGEGGRFTNKRSGELKKMAVVYFEKCRAQLAKVAKEICDRRATAVPPRPCPPDFLPKFPNRISFNRETHP